MLSKKAKWEYLFGRNYQEFYKYNGAIIRIEVPWAVGGFVPTLFFAASRLF
jgi:hypothetical protein